MKMEDFPWALIGLGLILIGTLVAGIVQWNYRGKLKDKQDKIAALTEENRDLTKEVFSISKRLDTVTQRLDTVTQKTNLTASRNEEISQRIEEISGKIKTNVNENTKLAEANRDLAGQTFALGKEIEEYQTGGNSFPIFFINNGISLKKETTKSFKDSLLKKLNVTCRVRGSKPLHITSYNIYDLTPQNIIKQLENASETGNELELSEKIKLWRSIHIERNTKRLHETQRVFLPGIVYKLGVQFFDYELIEGLDYYEVLIITNARNGVFFQYLQLKEKESGGYTELSSKILRKKPGSEERKTIHKRGRGS